MRRGSRSIVAGFATCGIVLVVTAIAVLTAFPADSITQSCDRSDCLVSSPDLPLPDTQPGTIPGAAELEDDPEPLGGVGMAAGRLCAHAPQPVHLARHLIHIPFAAPRSVPLRA
jgi:hypothetical protein